MVFYVWSLPAVVPTDRLQSTQKKTEKQKKKALRLSASDVKASGGDLAESGGTEGACASERIC